MKKEKRVKEDSMRGPTHLLRHTALHTQPRIAEKTPLLCVCRRKLRNCSPVCACVCLCVRDRQRKDSIPLYITSCLEHTPVGGAKAVELRDRAPTPPPSRHGHTHLSTARIPPLLTVAPRVLPWLSQFRLPSRSPSFLF